MIGPTYDLLLEYLSALRQGTWETFKAAARVVAERGHRDGESQWAPSTTSISVNLSALGHIEFAFDDTLQWQAAPTTIIGSSSLGVGYGILCGGRDSRVIESIQAAARVKGASVNFVPQRYAPSVVTIHGATNQVLADIAMTAGVRFDVDLAGRILRCAPDLSSLRQSAPERSLPQGYEIKRFDTGRLEWVPVERVADDGSFAFARYRPEHRIVQAGKVIKVSRSVAVYHALALARRTVIEYSVSAQELTIPWQAYPPELYARTLVLFSGRVPTHELGCLRFGSVPLHAALIIQKGLERE